MCWDFKVTTDSHVFRLRLIAEYDGELKYLADLDVAATTARAVSDALIAEKRREDDLRSMPQTLVQRFDRRDANATEATFRRLCAQLPTAYVATLRPVPELIGLTQPRRHARAHS